MKKRILSLFLTLVMLFSLLPMTVVTAWAADKKITAVTASDQSTWGSVAPQSVNVSYSGSSGYKVTPSGNSLSNSKNGTVITATPNPGYSFAEWKLEGSTLSGPSGKLTSDQIDE